MSNREIEQQRRKVIKAIGGGAVLLPLASLTACSGDKAPPAEPAAAEPPASAPAAAPEPAEPVVEAAPEPAPEPAAEAPAEEPAAPAGDMPVLSEDDAQAKALGYVADASQVDTSAQPRYEAGQACENCMLYIAREDSGLGACSIFPGKLVNAKGWCSVYAAKPA